jgi:hypothetical protein
MARKQTGAICVIDVPNSVPMNYFVVGADGKEYGPVDLATLAQWAKDDRVRPNTVLKDFDTGRSLTAHEVPGLFQPMAAPAATATDWSQAPGNYQRPVAPVQDYEGGKSAFMWAFIDAGLSLVSFFGIGGLGLIFGAFGLINAFRAKSAGHPHAVIAIVVASVALGIVVTGWIVRAGAMVQ